MKINHSIYLLNFTMSKLIALLLLLCLNVYAQQLLDCSDVACIQSIPECGEKSCTTLSDGCCESCCETECFQCFQSPCADWSCLGPPEYTCRDDYCGGCNRIWFDGNGAKTECLSELQVSLFTFFIQCSFHGINRGK